VQQIPALFIEALRSLEIADIVLVPRALARVAGVFASFAGRFLSWAGEQVMSLLQIIFEVVAPAVVPYIRRAAGAFQTIIRNPIGFVGNLVRAGIQGFRQFAGNFLTHLRASLIGWLTGAMSGANIYIPQAFNLQEILKFVLSVLGLTWQNIRQKLVRAIGETAVAALETGFDIVVTLVREGPAAAWQKILEAVGNLRDMVIEQVMGFVRTNIVQAAITRLVTSLNPAGAFIQAIIATYNTIMFFVERLQQIGRVAMAFIDSIAAIASGAIGAAANRVEQTMAGMLTLVISFLARIVGLGNVAQAVTNIINRVRQPIDRALDRVVEWIVATARRLGRLVASSITGGPDRRSTTEKDADLRAAVFEVQRIAPNRRSRILLMPTLLVIKRRYRLAALDVSREAGNTVTIRAAVNPEMMFDLPRQREEGTERWIADRLLQASRTQLRLLRREDTITQVTTILQASFQTITGLPAGSRLEVNAISDGRGEVRVHLAENPPRTVLVGRIIPPNEGFIDSPNPDPRGRANCARHIRTGLVVVKDARGAYLGPRVIRDLNPTDAQRLRRRQGIEPAAPSSTTTILEHVEGADSAYTSTSRVPRGEHMRSGTRDRNTGEYRSFFDSVSGRVEINLFRISSSAIFDLSTRVAQQVWGISAENAGGAQAQAMRDTLRTMEVLIRGDIPYDAVRFLDPPTRPPRDDPY
jgi:dolichol kinase